MITVQADAFSFHLISQIPPEQTEIYFLHFFNKAQQIIFKDHRMKVKNSLNRMLPNVQTISETIF
jgi:hypothetical protein